MYLDIYLQYLIFTHIHSVFTTICRDEFYNKYIYIFIGFIRISDCKIYIHIIYITRYTGRNSLNIISIVNNKYNKIINLRLYFIYLFLYFIYL